MAYAYLYNMVAMDNLTKTVTIDWEWVRTHLSARERLEKIAEGSTKEAVLTHLKEALDIAESKAAPAIALVKKEIINFKPYSFEVEGGITLSGRELSSYMKLPGLKAGVSICPEPPPSLKLWRDPAPGSTDGGKIPPRLSAVSRPRFWGGGIKGATHIYAFLVTIGKGVEEAATSLMNSGDHLLGYLLDRAGSFAVESMAKNMEDTLRRSLAPENLSVSMRFSPGYCDWPIEEQFKLAGIIDFAKAGVVLTENCVMIPKKSISAVVGIGPKVLFAKVKSPCAVCNMKVCDYRRID